ncbi:hypothetical protein Tco_0082225 [Tanacetum coccineum]
MESHPSSITVEDDHPFIYFRDAPPLHHINYQVLNSLCQMTILFVAEIHVEKRSPFKTHYVFMIMSIILLSVGLASGIVICAQKIAYLVTCVIFAIAVACYPIKDYSVAPFFTFLAPLAVVLMMYLPDNFKWISILIAFVHLVLFVVSDLKSWKERRAWEAMHADNLVVHPLIQEDDMKIVF